MCMAVPIVDERDYPLGGLSVAGPVTRCAGWVNASSGVAYVSVLLTLALNSRREERSLAGSSHASRNA